LNRAKNQPAPPTAPAPQPVPELPNRARRRSKETVPAFPQEQEIERFFAVIESPRDRAIFRIMYHAGLRASEVGLLQLRDYSAATERLMIHRLKGSHSGEHHLNQEEADALRAWLMHRGAHPGPLFASREGTPISRKMLDVLVKKYGALAGWPQQLRHCHAFKHACCTHLLSKGFNVERVQDWVGHANIQSTMIYARVTNARRTEMGRQLNDWR
jgi:integrase